MVPLRTRLANKPSDDFDVTSPGELIQPPGPIKTIASSINSGISRKGCWIAADGDDHGYLALRQGLALIVGASAWRVKHNGVKVVQIFSANGPTIKVANGTAQLGITFVLPSCGFKGEDGAFSPSTATSWRFQPAEN